MSHTLESNLNTLNGLYRKHLATVEDLQSHLMDLLPEFQQQFDLDLIQVERLQLYLEDKGTLFRFLRRAGFDFDTALRALTFNIQWRIENEIDTLSLYQVHPYYLKNGLFYFHKTDKYNRPYAIINLREYNTSDEDAPSVEEFKRFIIFNAEIARKLLWDATKKSDCVPVLQYVILLDLKGAGVSNMNIELGPFMMDLARHHYPSSIAAIFVLNYGLMYSGLWQIAKRLLPEESLGRIFFPTHQELLDYFDKNNILTEHGGNDDYLFDLDTCNTLQTYGRLLPVSRMPLSRVSSFDDVHDVFFSARSSPYPSRPGTPHQLSSPHFNNRSAVLDQLVVPSWLMMTPSANTAKVEFFSSHDSSRKHYTSEATILSPHAIKPSSISSPKLRFTNNILHDIPPLSTSDVLHRHATKEFEDMVYPEKENSLISSDPHKVSDYIPPILPRSTLQRLQRLRQTFKIYFMKLVSRVVARRLSGALYWLVFMVVLRGGLINDFWSFITQRVTMQLGWSASTTTALTTSALSAALSGRPGNQLLLGR